MSTFWLNNKTNVKYSPYEALCIVVVYEVIRRGNKKWVLLRKEGESTLHYMWVGSVGRGLCVGRLCACVRGWVVLVGGYVMFPILHQSRVNPKP
jgi:hypothetical protein